MTVDIVTQRNDISRTGANLQETSLTTSNVDPAHFGKLFTRQVDGHIYAQPLYLSNMAIPDKGTHNVVYVATMHNTVYAFDADDPQASDYLWKTPLEPSVPLPDPNIGPHSTVIPPLQTFVDFLNQRASIVSAAKGAWDEFRQAWSEGLASVISLLKGGYDNIAGEVAILTTPVISLAHHAPYAGPL